MTEVAAAAPAPEDVTCGRCGHTRHKRNHCRHETVVPCPGTAGLITLCNCPPEKVAEADALRQAHEDTLLIVEKSMDGLDLLEQSPAGGLVRLMPEPMQVPAAPQPHAGSDDEQLATLNSSLTPSWCVDAFHRVNPGCSEGLAMSLPSLYLWDFAREVLRVYGRK